MADSLELLGSLSESSEVAFSCSESSEIGISCCESSSAEMTRNRRARRGRYQGSGENSRFNFTGDLSIEDLRDIPISK